VPGGVSPLMDDTWDAAERLLTCVHQALAETPDGAPARHCVVPGALVAWDDCECDGGQLTVHVVNSVPSRDFPFQVTAPPFDPGCLYPYTVVHLVVTMLRCVPVQDDRGRPPTCAALSAAAHTALSDRWAMQRGAVCCWSDVDPLVRPKVLLQDHLSVGGDGHCAGSELHVMVGLKNCLPCVVPEPPPTVVDVVDGGLGDTYPPDLVDGGTGDTYPTDLIDGGTG